MTKNDEEKIRVSEQIFEVRHLPSGTFFDVRGSVADFVKDKKLFPYWKIDSNVINFADEPDNPKIEGAFIGYKSVGYFVFNASTLNFFPDKAASFWKKLLENKQYKIPEVTRFGARTRVFIPSRLSFEEINDIVFRQFFTSEAKNIFGENQNDMQVFITLREKQFNVVVSCGPTKKDDSRKHFSFESEHFKKNGFFFDLDYSIEKITHDHVPKYLHESIDLTWKKIEHIASELGF